MKRGKIFGRQVDHRDVAHVTLIGLTLTLLLALARTNWASGLPCNICAVPNSRDFSPPMAARGPQSVDHLSSLDSQSPSARSERDRRPSIYAIPSSDGASMTVAVGRLGQLALPVYANVGVKGPTSYERSHTLDYQSDSGEYRYTFEGLFSAETVVEGRILISTTLTPTLGYSEYRRHYVPITGFPDMYSTDGWLKLDINPSTFSTDVYVLIMTTYAPPGDPLPGYRPIGQAYSVRASGSWAESPQPMMLQICYHPVWLAGADSQMVSLFAWDDHKQQWEDVGGSSLPEQYCLVQSVWRFATYALMVFAEYKLYLPLLTTRAP